MNKKHHRPKFYSNWKEKKQKITVEIPTKKTNGYFLTIFSLSRKMRGTIDAKK